MGRPIVILTAPSGAGKSTLMRAAVEAAPNRVIRLRSVTTRPHRNHASDESYIFVARTEFETMVRQGAFAECDDYNPANPHLYGTPHRELERVGPGQVGIKDMTESGLAQLRDAGYGRVHHVLIEPRNHPLRSTDRVAADEARAKLLLVPPSYRIINDHALPNREGFHRALAVLTNLLNAFAAEPD